MVNFTKIYKNFKIDSQHKNSIVLIGNFDGVHLGHQKLFSLAKKYKKKYSSKIGVLTFEPMPKMFFNKQLKNFRISSLEQKLKSLTNLKVDANYELDEMDLTVIGKRITSSCYLENNVVEDFYVSDLGYKNELIPFSENCLSGFNKDSYSVKYFDINKNLLFSEGNLECDIPEMSLYLRSNQDIFVEVCYES